MYKINFVSHDLCSMQACLFVRAADLFVYGHSLLQSFTHSYMPDDIVDRALYIMHYPQKEKGIEYYSMFHTFLQFNASQTLTELSSFNLFSPHRT